MTSETANTFASLRDILPVTAFTSRDDHLLIGGCDTVQLAQEYGTPLYAFDEDTLRGQCRQFLQAFRSHQHDAQVCYAAKAYLGQAVARLLADEGLGLDVVSGGELAIAQSVDFPPERIVFHGNNKSAEELLQALRYGIGRIAVDNFYELSLLNQVAQSLGRRQKIILRLSPGIDPHTHHHTTTGILDSKFGIPIPGGQAEEAVRQAMDLPNVELMGLHVHLGSPIFEIEPYRQASKAVIQFAAEMNRRHSFEMQEYSPGGGFAVQYVAEEPAPPPEDYARAIFTSLAEACRSYSLPMPRVTVEPGRAIVGRAGVALYTVGGRKEAPNIRTFVSVDGGMADNIRPAIYGSRYTALVANKTTAPVTGPVTIAGKYCESGDILIRDIALPRLEPGDILALPAAGAYCLAMASNYNASQKPAVVMLKGGRARLIRRREVPEDLIRLDVTA